MQTLDSVTKLLGLSAGFLLVLSTAFDFSYLYALGLAFEDVPTSLADHVRSALVWAPKAFVYVLVIAIYDLAMRRLERGQSEEELIRQSPAPRFTRWFRQSPKYLFGALVAAMLISDTLFTSSSRAFYFGALVAWGTLALWVVRHHRLGAHFSETGSRLFVMVPIVVLWVGFMGYSQGRSTLETRSPTWSVSLKGEGSAQNRQLLGLRRFSSNAVLVTLDRQVFVLPNESIISATLLRSPTDDPHRLCAWFAVQCSPASATK